CRRRWRAGQQGGGEDERVVVCGPDDAQGVADGGPLAVLDPGDAENPHLPGRAPEEGAHKAGLRRGRTHDVIPCVDRQTLPLIEAARKRERVELPYGRPPAAGEERSSGRARDRPLCSRRDGRGDAKSLAAQGAHATTRGPDEAVRDPGRVEGAADDDAGVVHVRGEALVAAEGAEILHSHTAPPDERVRVAAVRDLGEADDGPGVVDSGRI